MTMGTAELLRLPEVQACIKTDFLLLSCDLLCEIPGETLLETTRSELNGKRGLSVFYQTQGREESVAKEATDFLAIAPLDQEEAPAVSPPSDVDLRKLVLSMPMDTVKEKMENDKGFLIRHSLVQRHAQFKMLTSYRDAHLYVLPHWVKDLARRQERLESVSEDLIGYWAKSEWQKGLGDKLGMDKIFQQESHSPDDTGSEIGESLEDEIDLQSMSTTNARSNTANIVSGDPVFASRVKAPASNPTTTEVPPILAYVQRGSAPFVRRVDSSAMLLSTCLRLAKLESIDEVGRAQASIFAHQSKIASPEGIAARCTVTKADCLLGPNVTVEEKCVIKESCIGSNVMISSGARITKCLIMDGSVIGPRVQLTGCIIGKRSKIGRESSLKDCEVQGGNVVPDETDAKNEKFMIFEGFGEEDDMDASDGFDDNRDDLGF